MPTYEYKCFACGANFERFQSITAEPIKRCPECGKAKVKRLLGTGAGVIFKGSGFYTTDYRDKSYAEKAKADSGSSPASSGDGKSGETKTGETKAGESKSDSANKSSGSESKPAATTPSSESKGSKKSEGQTASKSAKKK